MSDLIVCSRCNKVLQNVPCAICRGKGKTRQGLRMRTCDYCSGMGRVLLCPDALKHIREDYSGFKVKKPILRNLRKETTFSPPPPWHPSYPNPWHPNHPRNPFNPMNPNSPRNPLNPMNPNSPRNPLNPMNPNSPNHPFNKK